MRTTLLSALALLAAVVVAESDTSQILIEKTNGEILSIDIKLSDTVATLKREIRKREGIAEAEQRLISAGKHLEDDKTLAECGIEPKSMLYLMRRLRDNTIVHLKIKLIGVHGDIGVVFVNLEHNRRIEDLKAYIASRSSIEIRRQSLFLDGAELDDKQQLSHYGINDNSTLEVIVDKEDHKPTREITVKILRGKAINMEVDLSKTVDELKEMIQEKEGIPAKEQRLVYASKQLVASKPMFEYGIQRGSVLDLVVRPLASKFSRKSRS